MAIKFFSNDSVELSAERPFVEEFVKQNPSKVGEVYQVNQVRLTRKGNGYLLETDDFLLFLFKNKPITQQLIGGLDLYQRSGNGYKLFIQLAGKAPYFQLGFDAEKPCYWILLESGKYLSQEEISTSTWGEDTGLEMGGLHIPLPPTQVPPREQPTNNRGRQSKGKQPPMPY